MTHNSFWIGIDASAERGCLLGARILQHIVSSSETEDDNEEDIDLAAENEDQLVDLEEDVEEDIGFTSDMQLALDLFQEQRAKGNCNFMEKFIAANASNRTLVQEVKILQNQRTMRRTWAAWKHPATMYYSWNKEPLLQRSLRWFIVAAFWTTRHHIKKILGGCTSDLPPPHTYKENSGRM